jgi:hypothetical protein
MTKLTSSIATPMCSIAVTAAPDAPCTSVIFAAWLAIDD